VTFLTANTQSQGEVCSPNSTARTRGFLEFVGEDEIKNLEKKILKSPIEIGCRRNTLAPISPLVQKIHLDEYENNVFI
jgi:hypothetical protein